MPVSCFPQKDPEPAVLPPGRALPHHGGRTELNKQKNTNTTQGGRPPRNSANLRPRAHVCLMASLRSGRCLSRCGRQATSCTNNHKCPTPGIEGHTLRLGAGRAGFLGSASTASLLAHRTFDTDMSELHEPHATLQETAPGLCGPHRGCLHRGHRPHPPSKGSQPGKPWDPDWGRSSPMVQPNPAQ